jgi:uncharacterized RDD family membrane protein YckC
MKQEDSLPGNDAGPQFGPCPFVLRLLTLVVDVVCIQLVMYLLATVLGGFFGVLRRGGAGSIGALRALTYLVFLAGAFAYYFVFEYRLGKTPGKFLTRTQVVTVGGGKPDRAAILARTAVRFIPFEWVSFLQRNPVGWHDSLSGTMVVEDRDRPGRGSGRATGRHSGRAPGAQEGS